MIRSAVCPLCHTTEYSWAVEGTGGLPCVTLCAGESTLEVDTDSKEEPGGKWTDTWHGENTPCSVVVRSKGGAPHALTFLSPSSLTLEAWEAAALPAVVGPALDRAVRAWLELPRGVRGPAVDYARLTTEETSEQEEETARRLECESGSAPRA